MPDSKRPKELHLSKYIAVITNVERLPVYTDENGEYCVQRNGVPTRLSEIKATAREIVSAPKEN